MRSLQQGLPAACRSGHGLVLAAMVSLGPAGCATLPADAVHRIQKASEHYSAQKYTDAERLLNVVISNHPRTEGVGDAYYLRAMCRYQQKQDEQAKDDLQLALQTTQRTEVLCKSHAQLGHLEYQREHYDAAARHYGSALPHYPDGPSKGEVYYRYADSLQKIGQWSQARETLPKVWHLFPSSPLAGYARLKFRWPHEYLAIQCGVFDRSELALMLRDRLLDRALPATIEVDSQSRRARHVVYVGQYRNYRSALADLPRVQQVAPDAYIVP